MAEEIIEAEATVSTNNVPKSDIQKIIAEQRTFFNSGATKPVRFRIRQLKKLRDALEAHESRILGHYILKSSQILLPSPIPSLISTKVASISAVSGAHEEIVSLYKSHLHQKVYV